MTPGEADRWQGNATVPTRSTGHDRHAGPRAGVAQAGDTILVHPGTFAHFTMNVGVTLRAVTPGTVDIHYDMTYWPPGCPSMANCTSEGPTRFNIPVGQEALVQGIPVEGVAEEDLGLRAAQGQEGAAAGDRRDPRVVWPTQRRASSCPERSRGSFTPR
jgi:hypothetical protein